MRVGPPVVRTPDLNGRPLDEAGGRLRPLVEVPDIGKMQVEQATKTVETRRLRFGLNPNGGNSLDALVVSQSPEAHRRVPEWTQVIATAVAPPPPPDREAGPVGKTQIGQTKAKVPASKPGSSSEPGDAMSQSPQGVETGLPPTAQTAVTATPWRWAPVAGILVASLLGLGVPRRLRKSVRNPAAHARVSLTWDQTDAHVTSSDTSASRTASVGVRVGAEPAVSRVRKMSAS